jgi:hypothetical protein
MTEKPVELSITVKVYGEVIEYTRKVAIAELETGINQVMQEIGNKVWWTHKTGHFFRVSQGVPSTTAGAEYDR